MRCLTIIQPYAELITRGDKRVENRRWYTSFRGPLAIHAGKAKRYGGSPVSEIAEDYEIDPASLAFGEIIATATMVDCVKLIDRTRTSNYDRGPWWRLPDWAATKYPWMVDHEHTEGPYCFVLDNVRRLARPLSIDGAQGFWTIDDARINEIGYAPVEAAGV